MRIRQADNTVSDSDRPESFQLKGALFPMTLLEIKTPDLTEVERELSAKIKQAPGFFKGSAIVFGFEQLSEEQRSEVDLAALFTLCKNLALVPTAVRGGDNGIAKNAEKLGLATLPKAKSVRSVDEDSGPTPTTLEPPADAAQQVSAAPASTPTKIVSTPIRSGQQIYARGDLIILSSVSAGAEVLADGNIHIYGALRGRALAGIQGDLNARIFCMSQEAELISIAGQFLVDEVLRNNHWKQAVQIYVAEDRLITAPLV